MAQALRLNDESTCPHARAVERDTHHLTEIMMDRFDRLTARLDEHEAAVAEIHERVGHMAEMLKMMGDSCYALAEAADRLTADS